MEEFNCQHTALQNADVAVRNIIAGDRITTATILLCRQLSSVIEKIPGCHTYYDYIACHAEPVRNHSEYKESEACRKNNLGVIVNADFSGRGMKVGCRNGKLSAGCKNSCKDEEEQLIRRKGFPVENHPGKAEAA